MLWAEGERQPKMMSIALHPRMIGRPGRIAALDRIEAHMNGKGGDWFATRRQIAEHWLARFYRTRPIHIRLRASRPALISGPRDPRSHASLRLLQAHGLDRRDLV